MSVQPWYTKFEGGKSDRAMMRHVSREFSKSSQNVEVIKMLEYDDIKPLLDSVSKFLKDPTEHNREILKARMSYFRDLMLDLQGRIV